MGPGERGGSVVECWTLEPEVGGLKPTAAVLCPWARHFTPRKYWLITQEAVALSRHDWKIVDWDVKPQHKQTNKAGPAHVQGTRSDRIWSGTKSGYVNAPCSSYQTKSLTFGGKNQSSNKNGESAMWCKLVKRWNLDYYKNLWNLWSLIFEEKW